MASQIQILACYCAIVHFMDKLCFVDGADVTTKLMNDLLKGSQRPLNPASAMVSNQGVLIPNYKEVALKMALPALLSAEPRGKMAVFADPAYARDELKSTLRDWLPARLTDTIESEIESRVGRVEELDAAEEQANLDLVKGINFMADHNETIDSVVDDVLHDNHQQ